MNLRRRVGAAQHILLRVYVIAIVQIERGTLRDRERERNLKIALRLSVVGSPTESPLLIMLLFLCINLH